MSNSIESIVRELSYYKVGAIMLLHSMCFLFVILCMHHFFACISWSFMLWYPEAAPVRLHMKKSSFARYRLYVAILTCSFCCCCYIVVAAFAASDMKASFRLLFIRYNACNIELHRPSLLVLLHKEMQEVQKKGLACRCSLRYGAKVCAAACIYLYLLTYYMYIYINTVYRQA